MSTSIRLLIADDDEDLTEILSQRFRRVQIATTFCGDAVSAAQTFASEPFDVAILDGKLPGNDGIGLVRQFRAIQPLVPLLMLSGNSDDQFMAAAHEAGIRQYLLKPCSLAALEAAVRQAFAQQRAGKQIDRIDSRVSVGS